MEAFLRALKRRSYDGPLNYVQAFGSGKSLPKIIVLIR
jgi:hypothetical protein